jgi:hypothetical protein
LNRRRKNKPFNVAEAMANLLRDPDRVICSMDDLPQCVRTFRNRGFLAAYTLSESPPFLHRILVESCADTLVGELQRLYAQGQLSSRVCLASAAKRELLRDPEWEARVRAALDVIAEAEERGDDKAIRRLKGFLRSTRKPAGPQTKRQTHRNMIEVIKRLQAGEDVKSIAGADEKNKLVRALHTNLRRFCLEVYDDWMHWSIANPLDAPEKYNELIEKHLVQSCDFDLPAEKSLAEFAFDRAKQHYLAVAR